MFNDGDQRSILSIRDLCVDFGDLRALENVSLSVGAGERVALLGHNGAGKSTLFKAVLGFIRSSHGEISVLGGTPASQKARLGVSYLPESVAFPKTLTGAEIIHYFAKLKSVEAKPALSLLDLVGLGNAGNRRVGTYSKGMRQRLGLAQALIGSPHLLLLDEPTSGLDPVSRCEFYDIIDLAASRGVAVLLSSHALSEVEDKTDRIAILSKGRLVANGSLNELARSASLPIRINIRAKDGCADGVHQILGGDRINGRSVVLTCMAETKVGLLSRVAALGDDIDDIDITMPSLDDIYRFHSNSPKKGDAV